MSVKRVCVIGAGPSGMSVLGQLKRVERECGVKKFEVVCFDKQANWGGLWILNWRTGLDKDGEPVHGSMYNCLWSNGPAEMLEYPDYPMEEHFGKPVPSFLPRAPIYDYLQGYWTKQGLQDCDIRFRHVIRSVEYDDDTDKFNVRSYNLESETFNKSEEFDYVINCIGHFSTPNVPEFEGISTFPAVVTHSHDFRTAEQYAGQRVLVVGAGYSSDDIALQLTKYGAKSVTISYRSRPMPYGLPAFVEQKPLIKKIEGKTIHFVDGSSVEVDAIILATGYLHHYPYMEDRLRLKSRNRFFPDGLFNCTIWSKAGNNKLLYVGAMNQFYTFTMFLAQARWCARYLNGDISLPSADEIQAQMKLYDEKETATVDPMQMQGDWVDKIVEEGKLGADLNGVQKLKDWDESRIVSLETYRNKCYTSLVTGKTAPKQPLPFMQNFNDNIDDFLQAN